VKRILVLLVSSLALISCNEKVEESSIATNKFSDPILKEIYTLQDERNTKLLLKQLDNKDWKYRNAAAMSFGSVQDSTAVHRLAQLKNDTLPVRLSAAYALGQIKSIQTEMELIKWYVHEKNAEVRATILESVGKSGTELGLNFLTILKIDDQNDSEVKGRAAGLYRLSLNGLSNDTAAFISITNLNTSFSEDVRFYASSFLARVKNLDLTPYTAGLWKSAIEDPHPNIRMNVAKALSKSSDPDASTALLEIIQTENDYRVRVNAVNALRSTDFNPTPTNFLHVFNDDNINVAIAAAKLILENGNVKYLSYYLELARNMDNWRVSQIIYRACMRYGNVQDKIKITDELIEILDSSDNDYEKGFIMLSLAENVPNYKVVYDQMLNSNNNVFGTYCIDALVNIRQNEQFPIYADKMITPEGDDMYIYFATIFKQAIGSGDVTKIGVAAKILRNPKMNFRSLYPDFNFLLDAMHQLKLPRDMETYIEIQKTIDFIEEDFDSQVPETPFNNPIDWKYVEKIFPQQKVKLLTTKGEIILELMIEDAPGSTSNFLKLIDTGFYKNAVIHRVEPNFVVQGGCPRGDGWGSSDNSIRSEFPNLKFKEGYFGMASAGKDTETCQWFITHCPTPHLDGRYSIFGKVIEGMEVVHKLEIDDHITSIVVLPDGGNIPL